MIRRRTSCPRPYPAQRQFVPALTWRGSFLSYEVLDLRHQHDLASALAGVAEERFPAFPRSIAFVEPDGLFDSDAQMGVPSYL